jgi:replicative DNA helicase
MSEAIPLKPVPDVAAPVARLPRNVEAEAALIGALMVDNRIVEDVQMTLQARHFFEPLHGRIYDAILKLADKNMVANPVTLKPIMEADPALRELGGPGYLAQLTGSGAAVIGARDFARQIYELALLRELVGVGRELVDKALDTSEAIDPLGQIEAAEMALYAVAEAGGESGSTKTFAQASRLAIDMAAKALNSGGHVSGVTTGLDGINRLTGGLHPSDLVIVAGRPGMGKSSLATNIAFNAARRWVRDLADGIAPDKSIGAPVAIFNLEMSADQLATRILSEQSGISGEALRMGRINHAEFQDLARAARDLQDLPLYIDDTAALTIAALRTRARRLKRRHNIGMVVVDYLQLLHGSAKSGDNRVQEISEISRGLKTLAKELEVPVIALSQLSRAVESREDKRPMLSDLRESGSIEQDADMVWFLYRADYYHKMAEPERPNDASSVEVGSKYDNWVARAQELEGKAELIIAKQRHGATGKVPLHFNSRTTKFEDLAEERFSDSSYE